MTYLNAKSRLEIGRVNKPISIIKKRLLMAFIACLVCLVSTVSGCHKNTLGGASARRGQIT